MLKQRLLSTNAFLKIAQTRMSQFFKQKEIGQVKRKQTLIDVLCSSIFYVVCDEFV